MSPEKKLEALLYLMSKTQFHILEVEALAKALGAPNMTFEIVGPTGKLACKFQDPDYGIFADEQDRTFHVASFVFVQDVHCENLGGWS